MLTLKPSLVALLAATSLAGAAQAAPVWISIGDDAYQLLQQVSPKSLSQESRQLAVSALPAGVSAKGVATEKVHLVQVDDSVLPQLSDAIHHSLRHCGGFIVHKDLQDARTALKAPVASALLPSYQINDQAVVNKLLPQLQDSNILGTIQSLSNYQNRFYTTSHGVNASNWIASQWRQLAAGRGDVTVEQFAHSAWPQKSVILTIKGKDNAAETLVLGGHLDSTVGNGTGETSRAPGADDDASGIASLTEVIRVLLANNYQPRRTIKFMAYAAEEVGLRGSSDIANRYKQQKVNVVGALQLDMTNYQGSAEDIFLFTDYTNASQNTFLANLAKAYLPNLKVGYSSCGYACSDHASWHKNGYPASFPFESAFNQSNPNIHTVRDTLASAGNQARHALKFSQLALAYAVELGSDGPAVKR
ncbi:M20/M25/M40 family metallo-hydrolase [Chromobacterium alkanivorans]|uniref:M28 family metallopeptidase n=1 Tax=Chromobacterium alkanivorans TaxID=1071719 RepID=UPI0019679DAA|nr:M28 family metallopeptidase [Chromobacterium alkanivorans]MBN3004755.1 M20/M25/M40 family metallo-hydrolase [Chromobacterium alkanivorans]